ncbi:MAG: DUF302 domain-containing protein [Gammaproteobacteria bacterium]|nr:DUF302 domain-containing protein [Gammaproteobacteria bacterium]MCW8987819.1 DUF302 domain-containing protein [Gammaproteobacteria bacterium]MCW9030503.1 DUF302 domain-containing protein [Gammaproteobacteria bacterium]
MFKLLGILLLIPIASLNAETPLVVKEENAASIQRVNPLIYDRTVAGEMDEVYKNVFTALENNSYFVIFEPNIGKNLSHFAKRWGEDYNRNNLTSIRSMVFCSAWYANRISNIDPSMLALCPLRITLYSKDKQTHILFVRPGKVAATSKAQEVAKELEDDVIRTLEVAIGNMK